MAHLQLLILLVLVHTCNSLLIQITPKPPSYLEPNGTTPYDHDSQNYQIPSYYSTAGIIPKEIIISTPHILSLDEIDETHCTIQGDVENKIVILNGTLPSFMGCNKDVMGKSITLARILYQQGALGVLVSATEKYMKGRMTGFSLSPTIPVVLLDKSAIAYLVDSFDDIAQVTFPPPSPEDEEAFKFLSSVYSAWWSINLIFFIVVMDYERLFKKGKYMTNGIFLRVSSLGSCICGFLWLIVDPFGGNGYSWWHSGSVFYLHQGLYSVSLLCVLRHWMQASSSCFSFIDSPKIMNIISYCVSVILVTAAVWFGVAWDNYVAEIIYLSSHITALFVSGTGFTIFGQTFLMTFYKSGNRKPESMVLPIKIGVFIAIYILATCISVIVFFTKPLGYIFGLFFNNFYSAAAYYSIFLLLFFPKMEKKRQKLAFRRRKHVVSL